MGPAPEASGARHRRPVEPAIAALLGLLVIGVALRAWITLVWRPALTGYSDTGIYFDGAVNSLWADPIRTVGYSMFLRVLHAITPHLLLVTLVQHALGLATAVLFFYAVGRCGGPRWLGLAPAAIIALGGDQLFLEHAALSEALFIFLLAATLYLALRASGGSPRWAAAAGLLAGLGVWVRAAGVAMVAVVCVWLLFHAGRPSRRALALALVALVSSGATIGVYVEWRHTATGLSGLTTNNAWNLYGRVAPWADCSRFTPPAGTEALCEPTPVGSRRVTSGGQYIYDQQAPAQRLFGPPFFVSTYPHAMSLLTRWSEAAIIGEPLTYLHAVWLDTIRLVDPNHFSYGDLSARELIAFLLYGPDFHSGNNELVSYWQQRLYPHDPAPHHGDIAPLVRWERLTRVDGPLMVIALVLCLAAPWLAPRGSRAGATLFAACALVLLFVPILTKGYDYRFVIPAYAPLLAAGALAAWGLTTRVRALLARRVLAGAHPDPPSA
jgi:hypothetical protein